jgi:hypothetical protein
MILHNIKVVKDIVLLLMDTDRNLLTSHQFDFIGKPGGMGKSALFRKLHAACCSKGLLIAICAATSLAALSFEVL